MWRQRGRTAACSVPGPIYVRPTRWADLEDLPTATHRSAAPPVRAARHPREVRWPLWFPAINRKRPLPLHYRAFPPSNGGTRLRGLASEQASRYARITRRICSGSRRIHEIKFDCYRAKFI